MSRINNFKRFSKVYENEAQASSEEIIELAKKEMPLEVVADDALQLTHPDKSNIEDRMIAAAEQTAQAQPDPQAPASIKENYTGQDLMNPATMDILMKSSVARLPHLTTGSKVGYRGNMVDIPAGAEYVATEFKGWSEGYSLTYKDKSGRFPDAYIDYTPSKEEVAHILRIFDDLAKKSKWLKFVDKTTSIAGPTLALVGFGLFIFGMIKLQYVAKGNDAWLASGGGGEGSGSFSWDKVAPMGGYEVAAGGSLFGLGVAGLAATNLTGTQLEKFNTSVKKLVSVLKSFLEPINMKISDISTASDLQSVINTDINNNNTSNGETRFDPSRVAVEVAPKTTSNVRESRSTKNGKLRRF
jgi:hypothetical protein